VDAASAAIADFSRQPEATVLCQQGWDTVGELKGAEMCVSHMPSWKAEKLGKRTQEKVLLEL
jgi:hypothetical protein